MRAAVAEKRECWLMKKNPDRASVAAPVARKTVVLHGHENHNRSRDRLEAAKKTTSDANTGQPRAKATSNA